MQTPLFIKSISENKIKISSDAAGNVPVTLDESYEATFSYMNAALKLLSAEVINLSRNVLVSRAEREQTLPLQEKYTEALFPWNR